MKDIDYCVVRLSETKRLLEEQRKKNEIYDEAIDSIINEIGPKIKTQLEGIVLDVIEESGNSLPNDFFGVGIISPEGLSGIIEGLSGIILSHKRDTDIGKILGYVSYHGYLNKYDINGEFINVWVDKRFKEKLSELGIPEEYVSGIEIYADYPK